MKISRSAIIIVIAIILLLIAVFAMRSDEEPAIQDAFNASAAVNATNATVVDADTDPAASDAANERGVNATIEANSNSTIDTDTNSTTGPDASQTATTESVPEVAANATNEISANATAEPVELPTLEDAAYTAAERAANSLQEKAARSKLAEAEKIAAEKLAEEREAAEKLAAEKAAREKAEKLAAEKAAKEKADKEKAEKNKQDKKAETQPRVAVAPTTPSVPTVPGGAPGDVMNKLVDFGNKRVSLINRSIHPSKSSREVVQEGGQYVGRYYYVEPTSLSVEASPADPGSPFKYVGKVRYRECLYEVRASTRDEAMKGEGNMVKQRNMCELIQYKNNKWLE